MTWLRVDDGFSDHPKVVGLSLCARGLWITGLVYAGRYLTNGFIPSAIIKREGEAGAIACAELCNAGLWDTIDNGFCIHHYLDYNPSKSEVSMRRDSRSKAGKRGGEASAIARAKASDAPKSNELQTNVKRMSHPVPVPHKERDKSLSLARFDEWYPLYPRKINRQGALSAWKKLNDADKDAAIEALPKWLPYYQTRETEFIPHPSTWLNQRRWEDELPSLAQMNGHKKRATLGDRTFIKTEGDE